MRSPDRANLTGGHLLARNTLLNIAGEAAPLLLGLISIPIVVRELGADRYGVLALSYLVVGYLSLFDLGLAVRPPNKSVRPLAQAKQARYHRFFGLRPFSYLP